MNNVANTDLKERMSILNAYYFPGQKYQGLYGRISPVNSFRVVLNTYFGATLELLPDRSFFSTWTDPYRFIDVTDAVRTPDDRPASPDADRWTSFAFMMPGRYRERSRDEWLVLEKCR